MPVAKQVGKAGINRRGEGWVAGSLEEHRAAEAAVAVLHRRADAVQPVLAQCDIDRRITAAVTGDDFLMTGFDRAVLVRCGAVIASTGEGNITLTATGGASATDIGNLYAGSPPSVISTIGNAAGTGTITITANTLIDPLDIQVQTAGQVIFQPRTASTTIGVAGGAGTLQITSGVGSVLGDVTAGSITIGSTSDTGLLTADAYTWGENAKLVSGSGGITIAGTQTMGSHNLTLETDGTLSIGANLASSGSGTLTIEPATASDTIGVDTTSGSTLLITPTDLSYINSQGWANFTIGNSADNGLLTADAIPASCRRDSAAGRCASVGSEHSKVHQRRGAVQRAIKQRAMA